MNSRLITLSAIAVPFLLLAASYLMTTTSKPEAIKSRNWDAVEISGDDVKITRASSDNETGIPMVDLRSAIKSIRDNENKALNVIVGDKTNSEKVYEILNLAGEKDFLEVVFLRKSTDERVIYSIPSYQQDDEIYKYLEFINQSDKSSYKEIYGNGKKSVCFSVTATDGLFVYRGRKLSEAQLKEIISDYVDSSKVVVIVCYVNMNGTIMDWWAIGEFSKHCKVSFVLRKSQWKGSVLAD